MREVFGVDAPAMCAACRVAARHQELWDAGFSLTEERYRQAFLDCGIPVETVLADHTVWVPCWAEQLRALFFGTWDLAPILGRCSVDEEFLEAAIAVKLIAEKQTYEAALANLTVADHARLKVRAFAVGQGVQLTP